jgi:hypothetical protein
MLKQSCFPLFTFTIYRETKTMDSSVSPTDSKSKSPKNVKRLSPERTRRLLMSPVKKLSALRLVSPIDSDQELIDLEVASVLAEGLFVIICNCTSSQEKKCLVHIFILGIDIDHTLISQRAVQLFRLFKL